MVCLLCACPVNDANTRTENMFISKSQLLSWLNSNLQLRLEKVEDVSLAGELLNGCCMCMPAQPRPLKRLPIRCRPVLVQWPAS